MTRKTAPALTNSFADVPVINPLQLGGIETSVLDNGPGRGTRIAWVNTGGGLRYKVIIDRGLDIADAEFRGQSLTWHSFGGVTAPTPAYNRRMEWLRGFYGGLMVSCGPLNSGAPFEENGVEYGLHGTHSNTPALVESIVNPDPACGQLDMSLTALIKTAKVFGPNIELRRTLTSHLGENWIDVRDVFTNRGNQTTPFAWLLHINFGYPLLEPGTSTYCYRGTPTARGDSAAWFKKKNFKAAVPPQDAHRGTGEVFAYIDAAADRQGCVTAGVVNTKRGLGVRIDYNKGAFPRLGNWQHWGPGGSYVGALEPMTGGVEGRPVDRDRGWLRYLDPNETAEFTCRITASADKEFLADLLQLNK